MGLESGTYLDDLVITNPDGASDTKSQGDNHIRLLKTVLKNTFPGMAGRAMRTQSKAGNYTGIATDNLSILKFTAAATLVLTAAVTLGNGWACIVQAATGATTIDPNAAETVNGAATLSCPEGSTWLVVCDGSNFFAFPISSTLDAPSGTRMVFQQTSAPTGWTKEAGAAYNDAALKFTTGAVATGGADAFTTHFGTGKTTAGFTLTTAHLPASGLSIPSLSVSTNSVSTFFTGVGGVDAPEPGTGTGAFGTVSSTGSTGTGTTGNMGTGGAHSHDLSNFDIKYAECIVAERD